MLLWLRQKWIEYKDTMLAVCIASVVFHTIVILLIFFGYKGSPDFSFSLSKSSTAVIRLLPLGALKPTQQITKKNQQLPTVTQQKSKQKKHSKRLKIKSKKTALMKEKKQKKKKNKSVQEIVTKEDVLVQDKVSEKIVEKKEDIKGAEVLPEMATEKNEIISTNVPSDQPVTTEDVLYVNQKELDFLQLQQQLKDAIEAVWISPFGMTEDVVCEVLITVGWDGKLVEKKLTQPTSIYIYDRAVEEALDILLFPQQLWGKTIAIAFKP